MFKPRKNCNRYFDTKELLAQVNYAINIFESKTNGLAQGLFLFNNAFSHIKCAADAIFAIKMVKSAFYYISLYVCFSLIKVPPKSQASLGVLPKWALHAQWH
jgi:hypothetical protein